MIWDDLLTTWPEHVDLEQQRPLSLEWLPPRSGSVLTPLVESVNNRAGWVDLGAFSSSLKNAGVLDNKAVNLPGSFVVLPFGVRLVDQFCEIVRRFYREYLLEEYDYPYVAPKESFEPTRRIINLENRLFHIGNDADFDQTKPRATLGPTGEAIIYSHWRQIVRGVSDLPIRMYRRARYFRPAPSGKHSGRSIFRQMEAGDVFEFHCCFAHDEERQRALESYLGMLRSISQAAHVPTLWSTRPPWTNQGEIAEWAIGGDTPLPVGATVQTACLYNQGQIFSRAYAIHFKHNGEVNYPYHVTGAITRRLLLSHIMLGMNTNGSILVHPDLAPDQVGLVFLPGEQDDLPLLQELNQRLKDDGWRVKFEHSSSRDDVNKVRRNNRVRGVPLEIFVRGRRHSDDPIKLVITRGDTSEEAILFPSGLSGLSPIVQTIIHNVGTAYDNRARKFFTLQCQTATADNLREIAEARQIAVCPLIPNEDVALEVSRWHRGEILGYARGPEVRPCVLTGNLTPTIAFISPRI